MLVKTRLPPSQPRDLLQGLSVCACAHPAEGVEPYAVDWQVHGGRPLPTVCALRSSSFRNSEPFSRISMEELRRRATSSWGAPRGSSPASSAAWLSARPPGASRCLLQGPVFFQGVAVRGDRGASSGWGWLRGKQQTQVGCET